jgi:hypothetical protein
MAHSEETKRKIGEASKGRWLSKESRKKISIANTGRKLSEEAKRKISEAGIGNTKALGYRHTEEAKKRISEASKGNKYRLGQRASEETRKKMSKTRMGHGCSEETRRKISEAHRGSLGHGWKGGVTPLYKVIRDSIDFRLWREAVFERDNWTCQATGVRGGKLHPHHLQNFSQYPELRFAIDNGITLSEKAHKEFHDTYGYQNNTREQMEEYLNSKNCTDEKE